MPLATLCLAAVAACSTDADSGGGGDDENTLTIATGPFGGDVAPALEAVAKAFAAEHPGVTVNVDDFAGSDAGVFSTKLASGTGPDVFTTCVGTSQPSCAQTLAQADRLASIASVQSAVDLADEQATAVLSVDGELYGAPLFGTAIGYLHSKETLASSGLTVPTRWSEVQAYCWSSRCGSGRLCRRAADGLARDHDPLHVVRVAR